MGSLFAAVGRLKVAGTNALGIKAFTGRDIIAANRR
jgi:hypothetical protein